jgi:hypothetical protein
MHVIFFWLVISFYSSIDFLLDISSIKALGWLSINCGEAEVVLLDDGWIQRIEIKHHNDVVIESSLWFQD